MKNRNLAVDDNWQTPPSFYDPLNLEFKFDFDPCPYREEAITPETDGLLIPWPGLNIWVNPPYSRQIKEAFVKRAIRESHDNFKTVVMILPVSTSTVLFHDFIKPNAFEIRFVKGRIKFMKRTSSGEWVSPHGGMHDSMIVIFKG